MNKRQFLIGTRLLFGFGALFAVGFQAFTSHQANALNPVNFLSFFTNLSNIFAAVVFITSALYLVKQRQPSRTDDTIRGASVLYMAITGIVYGTLLTDVPVGLLVPWVNVLLHYIMPIVVVADWLYQPQKTKLPNKTVLLWLIFPALYLVYSLIRGAFIGWYPYPFLNPTHGGYIEVLVYVIGILIVFLAAGFGITKLGNVLKRNIN